MVDYIVISAPITVSEALDIAHRGHFKSLHRGRHGVKTLEFRDYGLREVSVWADVDNMFIAPPDYQGSSFGATIDAMAFSRNHKSYLDILHVLGNCLPDGFTRKDRLEWKVKSVSFSYNFVGHYIKQYYMLLRSGYDLANISLDKQTERLHGRKSDECYLMKFTGRRKKGRDALKGEAEGPGEMPTKQDSPKASSGRYPQKRYRESVGIEVMLDYNESFTGPDIQYVCDRKDKDFLQVKVKCKKKKTIRLCKDYGVADGDFGQFTDKLEEMDHDILNNYLGRIAGQGRYYRYTDAERIVMESSLTRDMKGRLCDVMKGVSQYKGVSTYLSHVEDEKIKYPCMQSIRKRKYALEALKQLQKLGINPMNLSVRTRLTESMGGSLPNLMEVYRSSREEDLKHTEQRAGIANPLPLPTADAASKIMPVNGIEPQRTGVESGVPDGIDILDGDTCPWQ